MFYPALQFLFKKEPRYGSVKAMTLIAKTQNICSFADGIRGLVSPQLQCGNRYFIELMHVYRQRTNQKEKIMETLLSVELLWTSDQPTPDLYLKTQQSQQTTAMLPAGFEPTISASERQQTHALDRAATGIGFT
jgi:hypothetical protein